MTSLFPSRPRTGAEVLRQGVYALRAAGIDDAELEAEVLLRHVLGRDRTYFFLHLPDRLTELQECAFRELLAQRLAHKPLAYLAGRREFYGLDIRVQPGVLIPRPETELVVEACLHIARARLERGERVRFVDVGTGSGAIALAFAKHVPQAEVLATDTSPQALVVAGYNARQLRLAGRIRFLLGDLLSPVRGAVDLVAANLPYIPTDVLHTLAPEVRDHEPRQALDGGADGLSVIRRLIAQLPGRLTADGAAVLEIGHDQGDAVRTIVADHGMTAVVTPDAAGHDRVMTIVL